MTIRQKIDSVFASPGTWVPHGIIFFLILCFFGFLTVFNQNVVKVRLRPADGTSYEKAEVVEILQDNRLPTGGRSGTQTVKLRVRSGAHKGALCEGTSVDSYLHGATCEVGTKVIIQLSEYQGKLSATVYNYDRGPVLVGMILLFLGVLWLIGGRKGLGSAFSLVFTFICILFLYIPLLYTGCSPFLAAVIVVILTTLVSMYLIGGFSIKTLASILGTIFGVIVAGIIAMAFGQFAHLSGWNVDEIEDLITVAQTSRLQVGGLLFSGILISALGATLDVSMSVASTICEIYDHDPRASGRELFRRGINVGKDMMGTMSNTLILAFTGGAVSLMVMIYAYDMPYLQLMNWYPIGLEILQGLSGALGIILTVPFVSWMTAFLIERRKRT